MAPPSDVDELFGEGAGAPKPRLALVLGLVAGGLVLALLGLACSSAPGGLVVLAGWNLAQKDIDRLDNGYLPPEAASQVRALRVITTLAVMLVVALFILQGVALCSGTYKALWGSTLTSLFGG